MTAVDLLDVLRTGLPSSSATPRHVAVVGAGIAGLTAGLLLKEAGHRVTILEARNRLGGRINTYRGFAGRMYGELGAMRFPRQHQLGQHLIHERFGLTTCAFGMEDEDTLVHMGGRSYRRRDFRAADLGLGLPEVERELTPAELLRRAMAPLVDLVAQPGGWERLIEEYDRYSLLAYLLDRGVSEPALWLMGPVLNIESRFHFSLVEWFTHWHDDVFGDLEYIEAGSDTLANAFGPMLLDDTRLGADVRSIEQGPGGVVIAFTDPAGGRATLAADEVVVTVPFVLLRHMEISGLDAEKWFAIRNVYYGRAHKIFMQFSRRWWQEDEKITHGVTVTDLAIRNIVYTPAGQDPDLRKGVLIASYAWEQDSMAYSMLTEERRISEALEDLVKIHPQAASTFEFGMSNDWALDRHAGGIGPLFRPLEMTAASTTTSSGLSAGSGSPTTHATGGLDAGSKVRSPPACATPGRSTPGSGTSSRRPPTSAEHPPRGAKAGAIHPQHRIRFPLGPAAQVRASLDLDNPHVSRRAAMPKKDKATRPDWKPDSATGPDWKPANDATLDNNYGQAVSEAATTKPKPSAKPRPHADGQAHQGPK